MKRIVLKLFIFLIILCSCFSNGKKIPDEPLAVLTMEEANAIFERDIKYQIKIAPSILKYKYSYCVYVHTTIPLVDYYLYFGNYPNGYLAYAIEQNPYTGEIGGKMLCRNAPDATRSILITKNNITKYFEDTFNTEFNSIIAVLEQLRFSFSDYSWLIELKKPLMTSFGKKKYIISPMEKRSKFNYKVQFYVFENENDYIYSLKEKDNKRIFTTYLVAETL